MSIWPEVIPHVIRVVGEAVTFFGSAGGPWTGEAPIKLWRRVTDTQPLNSRRGWGALAPRQPLAPASVNWTVHLVRDGSWTV